jgi:PilZ domain
MQRLRDFAGPERRSRIRFPIVLGARYVVIGENKLEGTGRTVNISSHGVLMSSAREISPDTSITIVIDWPVLTGSVHHVALHIHGTVVRSDHGLVGVRFSHHELRPEPPLAPMP